MVFICGWPRRISPYPRAATGSATRRAAYSRLRRLLRRGSLEDPHWTVRAEMLFSCLICSVSAGLTNTASPSLTPPINDCVHGAMDHRYMVTLKQQAASSTGRRLDTREDRLSFLHDWFDKFTVGQHDSEGTYSNGATSSTSSGPQARLQQVQQAGHKLGSLTSTATSSVQTSSLPTHALHFFAATQLAVAVSASEEVRRVHSTHPRREHPPTRDRRIIVPHSFTHCPIYTCTRVDHRAHGRGPGGLLD